MKKIYCAISAIMLCFCCLSCTDSAGKFELHIEDSVTNSDVTAKYKIDIKDLSIVISKLDTPQEPFNVATRVTLDGQEILVTDEYPFTFNMTLSNGKHTLKFVSARNYTVDLLGNITLGSPQNEVGTCLFTIK